MSRKRAHIRLALSCYVAAYIRLRATGRGYGVYIYQRQWWMQSSVEQPRGNVSRSVIYGRTVKPTAARAALARGRRSESQICALSLSVSRAPPTAFSSKKLATLQKDHQTAPVSYDPRYRASAKRSAIFIFGRNKQSRLICHCGGGCTVTDAATIEHKSSIVTSSARNLLIRSNYRGAQGSYCSPDSPFASNCATMQRRYFTLGLYVAINSRVTQRNGTEILVVRHPRVHQRGKIRRFSNCES